MATGERQTETAPRRVVASSFLHRLPEPIAETLFRVGRVRRFSRGQVVFYEGDEGDSAYIVTSGRFAVEASSATGEAITVEEVGPGEIFGDVAILASDPYRLVTVRAVDTSEAIAIRRSDFEVVRQRHPALTEALNAVLADRLQNAIRQILDILYVPARVRVLRNLVELAEAHAADAETVIPITQSRLGRLAGTTRDSVNRVLRDEEKRGSLKLGRGRIWILDLGRLRRRAFPRSPRMELLG